jgi:hypothetical protein
MTTTSHDVRRTPKRTSSVLIVGAAAAGAIALWSPAGEAASKTETLRYHVKDVSTKLTHADGSVARAPIPEPKSGDSIEINALDYKGDSRKHAAKWTASQTHRCVFADGPPDCTITVAIGGSMLIFHGTPGTLVNGTGRYQGATGRILSVKEFNGGVDVVARVNRR